MSKMSNDLEEMPDGIAKKMFPDRPTEEVVAEIVAQDPRRHGVTVEERKRRALEAAKAEAIANAEFFGSGDVVRVAESEGKDRPSGAPVHAGGGAHGTDGQEPGIPSASTGTPAPGRATEGAGTTAGPCDHAFPDDADAGTICTKCGLVTFEQWVNS